ncbi:MAG: hypothetical protein U0744_17375 [Gemmataceae bacterium]
MPTDYDDTAAPANESGTLAAADSVRLSPWIRRSVSWLAAIIDDWHNRRSGSEDK